ncbi:MAG: UDP-N-acetylglucosamine 2-epimerase (non-hydrolyzing), partial [Deltaproteobacteria bacterium]|nr:UDP-N-acetylglucosamine 2-epimerase (non-hydrolyzing) [Deltaproteobacteria bacterium]
ERPDWVLVYGDTNSTLAGALAAAKLHMPVAHVEAGLRSFNMRMPEEINRIVTDRISTLLLTPSRDANENLRREGIPEERIFFVGNTMIDTLLTHLPRAREQNTLDRLGLSPKGYALLTLHRPSNVDDAHALTRLLQAIEEIAKHLPVIFPVHPRTRKRIESFGLGDRIERNPHIRLLDPLGYLDFLALMAEAFLVLTDSGGIQEETTALGVPCLTLRENTERPVTITEGTNVLCGTEPRRIIEEAERILQGNSKRGRIPERWDGRASKRIAEIVFRFVEGGGHLPIPEPSF